MYVCVRGERQERVSERRGVFPVLTTRVRCKYSGDFPLCVSVSFAFHMWRQMAVACVNQTNQSPEVEVDDDSTTSSVISLFSLL